MGLVAAAAIVAGLVGAAAAALLQRSSGLSEFPARWALLVAALMLAAWVGVRAFTGRGEAALVSWADARRNELRKCEEYENLQATTTPEVEAQYLRRAECAKLLGEVRGAEEAGKGEANRGAEFATISRVEREYLERLATSKFARLTKGGVPPSPAVAIAYGREVAEQGRKLPPPRRSPKIDAGPGNQTPGATGGGGPIDGRLPQVPVTQPITGPTEPHAGGEAASSDGGPDSGPRTTAVGVAEGGSVAVPHAE